MPVKGLQKKLRAHQEVASLASGRSLKETARSVGVSRRTVQRDLSHPSTQAFLSSLLDEEQLAIRVLYRKCLAACEEALDATVPKETGVDEEGYPIYETVPDYLIRLKGVHHFTNLAALVLRGTTSEETTKESRTLTWEEYKILAAEAEQDETEQPVLDVNKPSSTSKTSSRRKRGGFTKPRSPTSRSKTSSKKAKSGSSKPSTPTTRKKRGR